MDATLKNKIIDLLNEHRIMTVARRRMPSVSRARS